MSDGIETFRDLDEQFPELRALYSLQQLPQIVEVLAPHLPKRTLYELVRTSTEVTYMVAGKIGIDPEQFTAK